MKKIICVALMVVLLLTCLSACNFYSNMSGEFAGEAESKEEVKEMMACLAGNQLSDAKALMHPEVAEKSDAPLKQMSAYLAGRKPTTMELESIHVNTSTGTGGKVRQEQVGYKVNLNDGSVIYLMVVYVSNQKGEGFTSFQLILGMV